MRRLDADFRRFLRELRELEPALLPVRVRRRPLTDAWGLCWLICDDAGRPSHFRIDISTEHGERHMLLETLMHEWAHAVAWQDGKNVSDHGPEWGVVYARIYQHMVGE